MAGLLASPWVLLGLLALLGVSVAAYYLDGERSGSRRTRRSGKKVVAGAGGVGVVGLGLVAGVAEGFASTLGSVGDLLAQFPGFVAQVAIAAVGFLSVTGDVSPSPTAYLAVVALVMGLAIMVKY